MALNINMDPLQQGVQYQAQAPGLQQQGGPGLLGQAASNLASKQAGKLAGSAIGTAVGGPAGAAIGSAAGDALGPLAGQLVGSFFDGGGSVLGGREGPRSIDKARDTTSAQNQFGAAEDFLYKGGKQGNFDRERAYQIEKRNEAAGKKSRYNSIWEGRVEDAMSARDSAEAEALHRANRDTGGSAGIQASLGDDWTGFLDASGLGEGHGGVDRVGAEYNINDNTTVGAQYTPNDDGYYAGINYKFNHGGDVDPMMAQQPQGPQGMQQPEPMAAPLSPAKQKMAMDQAKFDKMEAREEMKFQAEEGRKNEMHSEKMRKMKSPLGE